MQIHRVPNSVKWIAFFALPIFIFVGCEGKKTVAQKPVPANTKPESKAKLETATFGAGCYWCSEAIFQRVNGIQSVEPGFMGKDTSVSYKMVVDEKTNYAEVCQVKFDPEKVSYQNLLEVYFQIHDPTSVNQQGEDKGPLYRSVIFFHNKRQQELATKTINRLNAEKIFDSKIVTAVEPRGNLIHAKRSEWNYFNNNLQNEHCQTVILPRINKFKKLFADLAKEYKAKENEKETSTK